MPSITVAAPAPPPPPPQQQQQQPQQPQPQQMFLPIFPVCAPIQQTVAPTPAKPKTTPLKKEYLETVSKDTRMMRWQRVLSYINAQRAHVAALQKRREELATAGRQRSTSLSLNRSSRSGDTKDVAADGESPHDHGAVNGTERPAPRSRDSAGLAHSRRRGC